MDLKKIFWQKITEVDFFKNDFLKKIGFLKYIFFNKSKRRGLFFSTKIKHVVFENIYFLIKIKDVEDITDVDLKKKIFREELTDEDFKKNIFYKNKRCGVFKQILCEELTFCELKKKYILRRNNKIRDMDFSKKKYFGKK